MTASWSGRAPTVRREWSSNTASTHRSATPPASPARWPAPRPDLTARTLLTGLAPGQPVLLCAWQFENPGRAARPGPVAGRQLPHPSLAADRPVRFVWSGDTVGQGWGINPELGGMRIYDAMRQRNPDFFIHSGDTIYADSPIQAEQKAEGGRIWKNVVTEEVSKVAETLKEFRGRHRYNLLDENMRRFARQVPQVWQWDDHGGDQQLVHVEGPVRRCALHARRT